MKVILINGSPNANGCTFTALSEVAKTLNENSVETEIIHVGNKDIRGCIACRKCKESKKSIALGKEQYGLPEKETRIYTPFIR